MEDQKASEASGERLNPGVEKKYIGAEARAASGAC